MDKESEIHHMIHRLSHLPGAQRAIRRYNRFGLKLFLQRLGRTSEERFEYFYKTNFWGSNMITETVSGPGSTIGCTEKVRREIPRLLMLYSVHKVLDAGCGDYNWFRLIPREGTQYIGADIVRPLIESNQAKYADQNTEFMVLDITQDPLPNADLMLCRDCLLHFSNKDILRTFENFLSSNISYLLASTFPRCDKNRDIMTGDARPLNLEVSPFNLCKAITYIDDHTLETRGSIIRLGLWNKEMLFRCLTFNKAYGRAIRSRFSQS